MPVAMLWPFALPLLAGALLVASVFVDPGFLQQLDALARAHLPLFGDAVTWIFLLLAAATWYLLAFLAGGFFGLRRAGRVICATLAAAALSLLELLAGAVAMPSLAALYMLLLAPALRGFDRLQRAQVSARLCARALTDPIPEARAMARVLALAPQPGGGLLLVGNLEEAISRGERDFHLKVTRLGADGSVDRGAPLHGRCAGPLRDLREIVRASPQGELLGDSDSGAVRVHPDGRVEQGLRDAELTGEELRAVVQARARAARHEVLADGTRLFSRAWDEGFAAARRDPRPAPLGIRRLGPDGAEDRAFEARNVAALARLGASGIIRDVFAAPDGKLLGLYVSQELAGEGGARVPRNGAEALLRFLPDGTLDPGFQLPRAGPERTLAVYVSNRPFLRFLPDGGFLRVGEKEVDRVDAHGRSDAQFNASASRALGDSFELIHDFAALPDGRFVFATGGRFDASREGARTPLRLIRLRADGTLDTLLP